MRKPEPCWDLNGQGTRMTVCKRVSSPYETGVGTHNPTLDSSLILAPRSPHPLGPQTSGHASRRSKDAFLNGLPTEWRKSLKPSVPPQQALCTLACGLCKSIMTGIRSQFQTGDGRGTWFVHKQPCAVPLRRLVPWSKSDDSSRCGHVDLLHVHAGARLD